MVILNRNIPDMKHKHKQKIGVLEEIILKTMARVYSCMAKLLTGMCQKRSFFKKKKSSGVIWGLTL